MSMANNKEKSINELNELNEMDKIYIRTHALRIQDPNISESQKANCKWRIAEVCDFQEKSLDFNRVNTTLTVEQETDVMSTGLTQVRYI